MHGEHQPSPAWPGHRENGEKPQRGAEEAGAVSLGLLMVISTVYEVVVLPAYGSAWKALLPKDDSRLQRELTRAFLSYLEVGSRTPA